VQTIMKSMGILCILLAALSSPVFPQGAETEEESVLPSASSEEIGLEIVFALGFEYGNYWGRSLEGAQVMKTQRTSPGISLNSYTVVDGRPVGIFGHILVWGFPNMGTVKGAPPEFSSYSAGQQIGAVMGPLFRLRFNQKLDLFYGAGPSFLWTTEEYTRYEPLTSREESFTKDVVNLGIGANILLRFAISKHIVLLAGCIVNFDFLSFITFDSDPVDPRLSFYGRAKNFCMAGLRPYVSIGYKLF